MPYTLTHQIPIDRRRLHLHANLRQLLDFTDCIGHRYHDLRRNAPARQARAAKLTLFNNRNLLTRCNRGVSYNRRTTSTNNDYIVILHQLYILSYVGFQPFQLRYNKILCNIEPRPPSPQSRYNKPYSLHEDAVNTYLNDSCIAIIPYR